MKFEGEVAEIDLLPSLVDLWKSKFTGAWRFENDAVIKIVYLKEGDVLSASSNERVDTLDEILLKSGKVTRDHVKQALAKRKDNESLGDALLALGFIMKKELAWARRVQVIGILRSILHWNGGSYQVVADYLPKREEGTAFYLPQIIVELVVTETDRSKIEMPPEVGDPFILERTPVFGEHYSRLDLNADADSVAQLIDGTRSAKEIAEQASSSDAFSVFKLLYALKILGLVEAKVKSQVSHEVSFELDSFPSTDHDPGLETPAKTVAVPGLALPLPRIEERPGPAPGRIAPTPAPAVAALSYEPEPYDTLESSLNVDAIEPPSRPTTVPMSIPTPARRAPQRPVLSTPPPPKKRRGLVGVVVLLLALGAGGAYYWWTTQQKGTSAVAEKPKAPAATPPAPTQTTTITQTGTAPVLASTIPPAVTTTMIAIQPPPTTTVAEVGTPAIQRTIPVAAKPAPAPAAPTDARYSKMAADYKANLGAAHFTVQFELVCQGYSLDTAIKQGGGNIWFIPIDYKGRECYRVFWGRFNDRAAAERAIGSIPAALRAGGKPGVVSIDALR